MHYFKPQKDFAPITLASGDMDVMFDNLPSSMQLIKSPSR